ncbi:MAG: hypothetical protein H6765_05785 [Candidatus Peribacteria bacterium]|nr:MAG: hypothetical protein H6765_05785 [Candidatus Peribacteria bacterium]
MTQGIKRVEELFEVRNPKTPAIIVPFDGKLEIYESAKKVELVIVSEPQPKTYIIKDGYASTVKKNQTLEKGDTFAEKGKSKLKVKEDGKVLEVNKEYIVLGVIERAHRKLSVGSSLKVKEGAEVYKGQIISTGSLDLREYMKVVGDIEAQRYIVREIKRVYTSQGQSVNDKYMEIVIKQLFSKVIIEDTGNSSFVPGTIVKYEEFLKTNLDLIANDKQPARGERLALGLTQVAKESDSWMSAASFQETIRVMVEASTKGSIDRLDDLKANVIIGRLLPVGKVYQSMYYGEEDSVIDGIEEGL